MATWTDIQNAAVAAGASITTALMTALRDNANAIAEGDDTAPRVAIKALERVSIFRGTATGGSDTVFINETGLGDVGILEYHMVAEQDSDTSPSTIELRLSDDNGSTWSSWFNISGSILGNRGGVCKGYVDLVTGTVVGHSFLDNGTGYVVRAVDSVVLAAADAIQVRTNVGSGANLDASGLMVPTAGRLLLT